jgi:hypothetical protein
MFKRRICIHHGQFERMRALKMLERTSLLLKNSIDHFSCNAFIWLESRHILYQNTTICPTGCVNLLLVFHLSTSVHLEIPIMFNALLNHLWRSIPPVILINSAGIAPLFQQHLDLIMLQNVKISRSQYEVLYSHRFQVIHRCTNSFGEIYGLTDQLWLTVFFVIQIEVYMTPFIE